MIAASVLAAVGAAVLYAVAASFEHQAARRERPQGPVDPRLLLRLLHRRRWLTGAGADFGGTSLQALALALGPLALVQPILIGGLILAIPIEAAMDRRRVRRHELTAVVVSGAGLAALLAVTSPSPGTATGDTALATEAVTVGIVVLLLLFVAWWRPGAARSVVLGVATGMLLGLGAALLKVCLARLARDPASVFVGWELYVLIVVEFAALALNQNAFQAGRLAGSLTGLTLAGPVVSTAIAVSAFQEQLALGGVRTVAATIAALVTVWGVWLVSSAWATQR
jgi:hypothetical protein